MLILVSLAKGPAHGYAIVQDVKEVAGVDLGPGTLYAALGRLEARGLIVPIESADRRRPYRITQAGGDYLRSRMATLARVAKVGLRRLEPS